MNDAWAKDPDRTTRKEAIEPAPWWVRQWSEHALDAALDPPKR